METGNGFNQFHLSLQQQQQQQRMMMRNHSLLSMGFPPSLALEVEKQRYEIDRFVSLQNETLKSALQEQRKQQLAIIIKCLEMKTQSFMTQKDEEIAKASRRTMELEDCMRKIVMENQAWERVAKENEAMVISLNNTLEQVKEKYNCFTYVAEDAESCCDFSNVFNNKEEDEEEEEEMKKMVCKGCNSLKSCFLFLPCRHLCSCQSCEAFLQCCPVCNSVKKASIEVLF